MLDVCQSGSFVNDGHGGILGPGRIVLCSSRSDQSSYGGPDSYWGGYFTGYERTFYANSTYLPLGLIGGITAGTDKNSDGWLSVTEVFDFAETSLFQWFGGDTLEDPVSYNGLSFDPQLVLLPPPVIRDVAITSINPYRTVVCNQTVVSIKVTAVNQGSLQETFTAIVSYNSTAFESQTISVDNSSIFTLFFSWNTTGIAIGNYTVTVSVKQLPTETDTADNTLSTQIQVSIPGDINGDGKVDLKDIGISTKAISTVPGDLLWNPQADITGTQPLVPDTKVDMRDIGLIVQHYGERYQ